MIEGAYVDPFFAETHLRRGRTALRPVVQISLSDPNLVLDALLDTGSEHVLADSSIAVAAGIDLRDPIDVEEIGLVGRIVEARFVPVVAYLHPPRRIERTPDREARVAQARAELDADLDADAACGREPMIPERTATPHEGQWPRTAE